MIRICLTIAIIIGATVLAFVVIVLLLNALSANGASNTVNCPPWAGQSGYPYVPAGCPTGGH